MERYDILERLAVGGMGEVFLARQRGQGGFARTVVIKQLLPDAAEEGEPARRLLDEARLAASVAHENVVTIHEVGLDDGRPFLAMEYVHGVALSLLTRRAEKRGSALQPMVAARIALDVARGLHAAHVATDATGRALGIVHRDVAPKNIIVRHDGIAKVADFGVAAGVDRLCRTATGAVPGTLSYMAPEQAGAAETSPRSDQFALGVVLWEMLTGARLFRADTPSETLRRLFDLDIAAPSSVPARNARLIPRALDVVVLRMLARNPMRRFADLAEAARALDAALPGLSGDGARAQVARVVEALAGDELARRRTRIESSDDRDGDDGRTMIIASRGDPPTPLTNDAGGAKNADAPTRRASFDGPTRALPSSPSSPPPPSSPSFDASSGSSWSRARIALAASLAVVVTLAAGGAAGVAASSQLGGPDREELTRAWIADEVVDGPVVYAATLGEYADERGLAPSVADPVITSLETLMSARLALIEAHWKKDADARVASDAELERALRKHDADAKAVLAVWPADLAKRALEDTMMFGRAPGEWLTSEIPDGDLRHLIADARKQGTRQMKKAMVRAARRADVDERSVQDAMWPLGQLFLARITALEKLHAGDEKQRAEINDIDARAKTLIAERFPAHFFVTAFSLWRTRGDLGEPGEPVPGYGPIPGLDDDDERDPARDAATLALAP